MTERVVAPPPGTALVGASVDDPDGLDAFLGAAGLDQVGIVHVYSGFMNVEGLDRPLAELEDLGADEGTVGMISWRAFSADTSDSFVGAYDPGLAGGTSASIARGDVDGRLLQIADQAREWEQPLLMRPNWEMNAPWYPWGAFTREVDGVADARPGNAPLEYGAAWRRIVILWEGGSADEVDAALGRAGLPGLTVDVGAIEPVTNVDWVWSPILGPARPESADHDVADYYPGDPYVDWVATDWYPNGDDSVAFAASERPFDSDPLTRADDFYRVFAEEHDKPFMIAEWGVRDAPRGNGDDPEWARDLLDWAAARPQVDAVVYFSRDAATGDHRLESFPRTADAVAARLDAGGFARAAPAAGAPPAPTSPVSDGGWGVGPVQVLAALGILVALALVLVVVLRRRARAA